MKSLKYILSLALVFGLLSGYLFASQESSSSANQSDEPKKHDIKKMEKERDLGHKKMKNKSQSK